jgi:imidazole glycerol-phosphate synthase subunit HisH
MRIGILNSGGCNINSITFALNRLGVSDVVVVKLVKEFEECDKIIIPGVGHAKVAMGLLWEQNLFEVVKTTNKPVLGICLGMQIMFDYSAEGEVECLGVVPGRIIHLPKNITAPQMGWNRLIGGDYDRGFVYFANSYFIEVQENTESYVEYEGIKVAAIIRKNNFFGCQFHPEKSGVIGQKILQEFIGCY